MEEATVEDVAGRAAVETGGLLVVHGEGLRAGEQR